MPFLVSNHLAEEEIALMVLLLSVFCVSSSRCRGSAICDCDISWLYSLFVQPIPTPDRRQSKMLITIDERGLKSIQTVFSIAICRHSGDK